jgi:hypothetical protein
VSYRWRAGSSGAQFVTLRGIVQSIDRQNRTVTLLGPDGEPVTIEVDKDVQNFGKLKVGQPATVNHTEAMTTFSKTLPSGASRNRRPARRTALV